MASSLALAPSPLFEVPAPPTSRAVVDLYASMLCCARSQAAAIQADDWETVLDLSRERAELLAASEEALSSGQIADAEEAASLLERLLALDASTALLLEDKRELLHQDMRSLRQGAVAAVGYRQMSTMTGGHLVDSVL